MGHSIPYPYSRVFINLIQAIDQGKITLAQANKTWLVICDRWERLE